MAHVKVTARYNEPAERLIKRFSRKVKKEGVIEEIRERKFYQKPSVTRRMKKLRRKRMAKKLAAQRRSR